MSKVSKYFAGFLLIAGLCFSTSNANAQWRGAFWGGGPWFGIGLGYGWGGYGWGGFGYWPWWGPGWGMNFYPGYYQKPYTGKGYADSGYPNQGFQLGAMPPDFYPFYVGIDLYYYTNGAFFRANDTGGYTVTDPPIGATVFKLGKNAHSVVINGAQYYEYKGVYYNVQTNQKGQTVYIVTGFNGSMNTADGNVVLPKVGTTINKLPKGSQKVILKGKDYYVSPDGIYYEAIIKDGTTIYRVASVLSEDEI